MSHAVTKFANLIKWYTAGRCNSMYRLWSIADRGLRGCEEQRWLPAGEQSNRNTLQICRDNNNTQITLCTCTCSQSLVVVRHLHWLTLCVIGQRRLLLLKSKTSFAFTLYTGICSQYRLDYQRRWVSRQTPPRLSGVSLLMVGRGSPRWALCTRRCTMP